MAACVDPPADTSTGESAIKNNGHLALSTQFLSVVEVDTTFGTTGFQGVCTGTLIAPNVVVTAAHCTCDDDHNCYSGATVKFRPDPANPTTSPTRTGTISRHPGFDDSAIWCDYCDDIAVVVLSSAAPSYVPIAQLERFHHPEGTKVVTVGHGHTGTDCQYPLQTGNPLPPPFWEYNTIDEYDSGSVIYDDYVTCDGDSGGPTFIYDGNLDSGRLYAVTKGHTDLIGPRGVGALIGDHYSWLSPFLPSSVTQTWWITSVQNYVGLDFSPSTWKPIAGDFNADGKTDYAQLGETGRYVYTRSGNEFTQSFQSYLPPIVSFSTGWEPIAGDFNNDSRTDFARLGPTGAWIFYSTGSGFTQQISPAYIGVNFGNPSSYQTITGDFNGDHRMDYGRLGADRAYFFYSTGTSWTQQTLMYAGLNFGLPSQWKPITGDFNGDGYADYGRTGDTGTWFFFGGPSGFSYYNYSFHAYQSPIIGFGWSSAWEPITGDFDGNGYTDYARVGGTGAWVFLNYSWGTSQGFQVYNSLDFGNPSAWQTITGDFNNDNRTDYARLGGTAAWFFLTTGGGNFTQKVQSYNGLDFGLPSPYRSIVGDFNHDLKGDYARLGGTKSFFFLRL